MTAEVRTLLNGGVMALAVTVGAWLLVAVVIGVLAAVTSVGQTRLLALLATPLPALIGAFLGARRTARQLSLGTPAAAAGFAGAAVVTIVLAALGWGESPATPILSALVLPVVGAATGAWAGGLREPRGA